MEPQIFVGANGDKLSVAGPILMTHEQSIELAAKLIVMAGDWPEMLKTKTYADQFANT